MTLKVSQEIDPVETVFGLEIKEAVTITSVTQTDTDSEFQSFTVEWSETEDYTNSATSSTVRIRYRTWTDGDTPTDTYTSVDGTLEVTFDGTGDD